MDVHSDAASETAADPCPQCGQPVGDAWLVCAWCGTQIAAPAELAIDATLNDGRYQVLRIIGRGGFGITYEAGDTRLKRRVAVKELFPESAVRHGSMVLTPPHARAAFRSSRERFLLEARVLARFTHPGIVRVYEVFEEHGTAYLVMELLAGRTLVDILRTRGRPFTEAELVDVTGRVAAALRPVHAAGVLHRDVNPSNVMLTQYGRIVVIDFGLARTFEPDQTVGMTRMVTPGYAPLEQYQGAGRFGPTTDVYGLAATCYRLGTGRVPVSALERDAGAPLPSPRSLNPQLSKELSDAILDGLELNAAHRPQDLDSFLARMGIRFLPDAPRSILLGSMGAMVSDLTDDSDPDIVVFGLADPGPAVAVRPPAAAVAAPSAAAPDPVTPLPPPPPPPPVMSPPAPVATMAYTGAPADAPLDDEHFVDADPDPDVTIAVPARVAEAPDPDRTAVPGTPAESPRPAPEPPAPAPPSPDRWNDPNDLPSVVEAPGRSKVTMPLAVLAVVTASAAPLVITALVVLVVLPALATLGDAVAQRRRRANGYAGGAAERRLPAGLLVPFRFVRNVGLSVLRTSPIIGVAAVALALWFALATTPISVTFLNVLMRLIGGGAMAAILITSKDGSPRFRTGLGIEELVRRTLPDGRISERLVVAWIVVVVLVVGALWLDPSPFPLPRP